MAHLPVIANTFRCALNWTATGGQTAVNVIHLRGLTAGHTEAEAFAAFDASCGVGLWGLQASTAQITKVQVIELDGSSPTQEFTPTVPANVTGGGGTEFVVQAANIVKFKTVIRGRSGRGRVFLPFVAENQQINGSVGLADAEAVEDAWEVFQANLHAHDFELVVASYKEAASRTVVNFSAETTLATQKRRQDRLRGAA